MSIEAQPDLQDPVDAFLTWREEMKGRIALLEVENIAVHSQFKLVNGDNQRLRAELDRAVARLRRLLDEKIRLTRTLVSVGRTISDGIRDIPEEVVQLRGVPERRTA